MNWFSLIGLLFDLAGAGVLAWVAEARIVTGYGGGESKAETDKRKCRVRIGFILLAIGFSLQVVPSAIAIIASP